MIPFLQMGKMKFIEVTQFAEITAPELPVQWVRTRVQREPEEKLMQINY